MGGARFKASFADIPNNTHTSWWKDPALRKNVRHCVGAGMCSYYLGYDQSLLGGLQALPQWNAFFNKPAGIRLGLFAATLFLPAIPAVFVADWMTTKFGRRIPIWFGATLIMAGAVFNALSRNAGDFMGSRVIIGVGGAITKVVAPALLQEIAHPRLRSPLSTLYYSYFFAGSIASAVFVIIGLYMKGDWGWRLACLMQIMGPIVVLLLLLDCPESPRWLIKNGKHEQAKSVLIRFHANGDADDALVDWEFQEMVHSIELEATVAKSSYLDFFRTNANLRRLLVLVTVALGTNMVGNGIISWYLTPVLRSVGITRPIELTGINLGMAVWNLLITFAIGLYVDRIGRRPLFFSSIIGMVICYTIVVGLSSAFAQGKGSTYGVAAVPFLFLYYGVYDLAFIPLPYAYACEILPYNMRAKGLALFILAQNLGNAFNQFVNPVALAAITWKYYLVYIVLDIVYGILIYFYYPETSRLSIEEVALIFDYGRKGGREQAIAAMEAMREERAEKVVAAEERGEKGKGTDEFVEVARV